MDVPAGPCLDFGAPPHVAIMLPRLPRRKSTPRHPPVTVPRPGMVVRSERQSSRNQGGIRIAQPADDRRCLGSAHATGVHRQASAVFGLFMLFRHDLGTRLLGPHRARRSSGYSVRCRSAWMSRGPSRLGRRPDKSSREYVDRCRPGRPGDAWGAGLAIGCVVLACLIFAWTYRNGICRGLIVRFAPKARLNACGDTGRRPRSGTLAPQPVPNRSFIRSASRVTRFSPCSSWSRPSSSRSFPIASRRARIWPSSRAIAGCAARIGARSSLGIS